MKTLSVLTLFLSFSAFASNTITCINPSEPNATYTLKALDDEHFNFTVKKRTVVPDSCRSRWGCDYQDKVVFFDKLVMTDYQGSEVYQSKRTYILIEDLDQVSYTYVGKSTSGAFVKKTVTLRCQSN